jgi:DNA-binding NtrC family response regulator
LNHYISKISTVLFIDDDTDILEVLSESMIDVFLKVYTANSARKGIELLSQHKIDCVVTDYAMPEMNGLIFVDYLKSQYPLLPVMLLTGHANAPELLPALEDRVCDIVTKPFKFEILVSRICSALVAPRFESLLVRVGEELLPEMKFPDIYLLTPSERSKFFIQLDSMIRSRLLTIKSKKE